MASLSREISTDVYGGATPPPANPTTSTQNKYSYPCLDITKSYFAKATSPETNCLLTIAKISLVIFPIFIILITLETAFDLIATPFVFLANCIAGPQTVTAPPISSDEENPSIHPEARASSGSHDTRSRAIASPESIVPPEEMPEPPILPTPELVKPRNISKKRWDALSQEERVDTLARIASAKNSVIPPSDSMAVDPHSPRRSQRIASPDRPTRSYAEATMGDSLSSSEPTTPQKTRPAAPNPPSIHEAHRRSKGL